MAYHTCIFLAHVSQFFEAVLGWSLLHVRPHCPWTSSYPGHIIHLVESISAREQSKTLKHI